MIMIEDVLERTLWVQIEAVRDVKTYNITTSDMNDSCIPYRMAQEAMMWLNRDGFIAELECIYPRHVTKPLCFKAKSIITLKGIPRVVCKGGPDQIWVEDNGSSFTIWFAQGHEIMKEVMLAPNLKVLATNNQVVGVTALVS